jgi:formate dehydrogenase iron-sulfur subunit
VPPAAIGVGAVLAGVHALEKRRAAVQKEAKEEVHPHFASLSKPPGTLTTWFLVALMAFGVFSFVARFVLGLGGATHLSDTHAWGLWILFDLVWIAVAAGAFTSAGLIYVLQRKDLYSLGRAAVLMGLLSYSFVMVTLLADLGQPWHFYQLALQAPEHSAMFEVSWCVGLYVTVLLLEFLPVPFEAWGLARAAALWRRYAPVYVVAALSLFVWLLSRKLVFAGLALAVFGLVAWMVRTPAGRKPEPILLAIAAVTFSTMHQSSLGSLFLLMPDSLDPLWWSPVMPVLFFLSSAASGLGLLMLAEMGMALAWGRRLRIEQLASLGGVAFWALGIYLAARLADVATRGELARLFRSPHAALFLVEIGLLGLLPLALYATPRLRRRPAFLGAAALLSTCGIILNRADVVVFAMTLRGPMPQDAASGYTPSVFEWGISIGLIAATFFLFARGVRLLPVLPIDEEAAATK